MNKKRTKVLIAISVALVVCATACGLCPEALPKGEDKSKVMISAGDAVTGEALSNVSVRFIPGRDNPDGEAVCQAESGDAEGTGVELPCGEYTVQWSADGYHTGYQNMEVREEEVLVRKWMIPVFKGDAAYILMEWEFETDLDLCVYNEQTGRCLGKETPLEDAGSFSYGDNDGTKGYELAFLKDYDKNAYAIYVKDNGTPVERWGADGGSVGMAVSIYTSDGMLYQREPEKKEGEALWHCADMDHGQIRERDEYVHDLTEHAWATRSKADPASWVKNANEKSWEKYVYDGVPYIAREIKYDSSGNVLSTLFFDSEGNMYMGYIYEYDANGNLLVYESLGGKHYRKEEYTYDENGNRIALEKYYDDEQEPRCRLEYEYNDDGQLISEKRYYGKATYGGMTEYEYDENGNQIAEMVYSCDDSMGTGNKSLLYGCRRDYDAKGNQVAYYSYGENGLMDAKTVYEYDWRGNCLSSIDYDGEGLMEEGHMFDYDYDGNLRAEYIYDFSGVLTKKSIYDENGNLIEKYAYEQGRLFSRDIEVFDENDNHIESYSYMYGKLREKKIWEYDKKGICIHSCEYEFDQRERYTGRTTTDHTYEYDAVGGMRIDYYYSASVLTSKTITLFY